MKKIILSVLLPTLILTTGCSNDPINPTTAQFDNFVDEILGYYLEGQEDTWFDQNEEVLNVYEDAIIFHSSDSASLGLIGFAYGQNDLTHYSVTRINFASWDVSGTDLILTLNDGTSLIWEIMELGNEKVTFKQESTGAIFSMKIMNT